jgi:hypothetical protein
MKALGEASPREKKKGQPFLQKAGPGQIALDYFSL